MPIQIREPIWNGGKRCVGIATYRLGTITTDIEIMYKNKQGERLYPSIYTIPSVEARKYPTKTLKSGVILHIIPIDVLRKKV